MSRTRGEGRSPAEKQQRVVTPSEIQREQRKARKAEEAEWAAKSGPVTVRRKGEPQRPFRDLCPEADERDAMTDEEFWDRVSDNLSPAPDHLPDDGAPDLDEPISMGICEVCGSTGPCGYDAEGRPLIHAAEDSDD